MLNNAFLARKIQQIVWLGEISAVALAGHCRTLPTAQTNVQLVNYLVGSLLGVSCVSSPSNNNIPKPTQCSSTETHVTVIGLPPTLLGLLVIFNVSVH